MWVHHPCLRPIQHSLLDHAKYIWHEVQASAPSLPSTLGSCAHFRLALHRLLTTNVQSSSATVRILPRYFKDVTWARGIPYAVNTVSSPALASSYARRCRFLSAPHRQKAVLMCHSLRELCDTNMSHWGHLGLGRFPSSRITIVSRAWRCAK